MAEATLTHLNRQRGTAKGKLTRIANFVSSVYNEDHDREELESRLELLEISYKDFEAVQSEIEQLEYDEAASDIERDTFERLYCSTRSSIRVHLRKFEQEANPIPTTVVSSPRKTFSDFKLPEIKLPHFSGQYSEWFTFWNSFNGLVHENKELNACNKFHYLRSQLRGDALRAVQSFSISEGSYERAVELLKARYENRRLTVQDHVNQVINAKVVNRGSYTDLRELIDNVKVNIDALQVLQIPTQHWDAILVPIVVSKFDAETNREWQRQQTKEVATLAQLVNFAEQHCLMVEALDNSNKVQSAGRNCMKPSEGTRRDFRKSTTADLVTNKQGVKCPKCEKTHFLNQCPEFISLKTSERRNEVRRLRLCYNCLRPGHMLSNCKFSSCKKCDQRHHTLLHIARTEDSQPPSSDTAAKASTSDQSTSLTAQVLAQVLLSTAVVLIKNADGEFKRCRALLDAGSQSNFLRKSVVEKLGLHPKHVRHSICGFSQMISSVNEQVEVTMKSTTSDYVVSMNCLVLSEITHNIPLTSIAKSKVLIHSDIVLSDGDFNKSAPIDLLLGAEVFWQILLNEQRRLSKGQPTFIRTKLGWVVGGAMHAEVPNGRATTSYACSARDSNRELEIQVDKFFQLENCLTDVGAKWTPEQQACEDQFRETVARTSDGRFVVKLPTKDEELHLGDSYKMARKRFLNVERKLGRDADLCREYNAFMRDYESLSHMVPVSDHELERFKHQCYLPHHPVLKPSSVTTKLRVVFDASAKTSNGLSLNDNLLCGPTIQDELFAILIRFRCFRYIVGADITKMYRQILINESDDGLQLILWRDSPTRPMQTYKLRTITYGTKPASFLATRCLLELANQNRTKYPVASKAILENTYMDDIILGSDDVQDAIKARNQLKDMLAGGGFCLSKWVSNDNRILPSDDEHVIVNFDKNFDTKALGLNWNCKSDTLGYATKFKIEPTKVTKRVVLSTLATIFDPLGLAGPLVTYGKIILRKIWTLKLDWDQAIPPNILRNWNQFLNELTSMCKLKIERWIAPQSKGESRHEMHGFADASMKAYGAAVYIRSKNANGKYMTRLLCAKSRIAPQQSVSLPRLELCAAQLSAKLMHKTSKCLALNIDKKFFWTDSTVVLSWLSQPAAAWQTFVANRVSDIQSLSAIEDWNHVASENNPADLISRGATVNPLTENGLWFRGPEFLNLPQQEWPESKWQPIDAPEARKISLISNVAPTEFIEFERFAKFHKLVRVVVYAIRFVQALMHRERQTGAPTAIETKDAIKVIVRSVQANFFGLEIQTLRNGQPIPNSSKLLSLSPFLDEEGILRVGGRLKNASISYDAKYPILLPSKHHVTKLIIISEHERNLHAGPLATLAAVRERFWVPAGRSVVRLLIRKCIRCFCVKPTPICQKMGNIPTDRVNPSRPFSITGVDYAGPVLVKEGGRKSKRLVKSYIAVFVCFASKAVHLELVSDLTSKAFLNTLRRVMARRGHITKLYSDNGTNFVGAKRELGELSKFFKSVEFNDVISDLTSQHIDWQFLPPRSPHMGGLWECNVKSVKFHLKRMTRQANLTYEELSTLLCRIEACINSRPISPLSSQPNDLAYLTPGHFLIGAPLTSIVEANLDDVKLNRLSRWQYVERLRQQFWKRWSREYLSHLQIRSKWLQEHHQLAEGDLVIVTEDNVPPLFWKTGRILKLHPGNDGLTRVVSVNMGKSVVKRAVSKLCALPIKDS